MMHRYGAGLQSRHDEKRQKGLTDVKKTSLVIVSPQVKDPVLGGDPATHDESRSDQVELLSTNLATGSPKEIAPKSNRC